MCLHPDIIDAMTNAGATAQVIAAACRAAYDLERDKKATKRAGAAERQRRKRVRDNAPDLVDVMEERLDDEQRYIDAAIENVEVDQGYVRESRESQPQKETCIKKNTSSLRSEVSRRRGTRGAAETLLTQEAHDLTDAILTDCTIDPKDTPPGWCGMTHAIQKFMTQGCPGEIIRFAVRKEIRRIGRVPERFGWFENPIKWAYQNHLRTPNLEIIDGGLSHQPRGNGGYGRSQNAGRYTVNDAARDLYQRTLAAYEAQCARDGTGDGAPRLLPAV